jgi:hypothetical protein
LISLKARYIETFWLLLIHLAMSMRCAWHRHVDIRRDVWAGWLFKSRMAKATALDMMQGRLFVVLIWPQPDILCKQRHDGEQRRHGCTIPNLCEELVGLLARSDIIFIGRV